MNKDRWARKHITFACSKQCYNITVSLQKVFKMTAFALNRIRPFVARLQKWSGASLCR
jgi:hypothetical protein